MRQFKVKEFQKTISGKMYRKIFQILEILIVKLPNFVSNFEDFRIHKKTSERFYDNFFYFTVF